MRPRITILTKTYSINKNFKFLGNKYGGGGGSSIGGPMANNFGGGGAWAPRPIGVYAYDLHRLTASIIIMANYWFIGRNNMLLKL